MSRTVDFVALINSVDIMPIFVAMMIVVGLYAFAGIATLLAVRD